MKEKEKPTNNRNFSNSKLHILQWIVFFLLFGFIGFAYYRRVGSFSFGDEWNNITAAFFMIKGKMLYSSIFYNHQMLIVYFSYIIQMLIQPKNLYLLILYHRGLVFVFSFLMSGLLLYRFGPIIIGFAFIFELTKFYLFGHLFLAESFTVYPLVFLFLLAGEKLSNEKMRKSDFILSSIFCWFIIFMREPYIPAAIFLFLIIIFTKKLSKFHIYSFIILGTLSAITILTTSIKDYFFEVVIFNSKVVLPHEASSNNLIGFGIIKALFYVFYIFLSDKWNYFRYVLIGLDSLFLLLLVYFLIKLKKVKISLFIIFILFLVSIRYVKPGSLYFDAFHMTVWYGLFISSILFLIKKSFAVGLDRKFSYLVIVLLFMVSFFIVVSPQSFLWDKVNRNEEFTVNYAHYYVLGETIKALAKPSDTLFADLWDYFIHVVSGLDSPYKYSLYSFVMKGHPLFEESRISMFKSNPPDFYYTYCPKKIYGSEMLPVFVRSQYIQLNKKDNPSCLYIKKERFNNLSKKQLKAIEKYDYYPPVKAN